MNSTADTEQLEATAREEGVDTAALHGALHQASQMQAEEVTVRSAFRRIIQSHCGAVGIGHVTRDAEHNWDLRPDHATGRMPRRHDFIEKYAATCNAALERETVQIEPFLGLQAVYVPLKFADGSAEVLLVLVNESDLRDALFVVEIATAYLTLSLSQNRTQNNDWKLVSLAALVELVSEIEKTDQVSAGAAVIANELVRHLGATQVAVGHVRRGTLSVEALSGTSKLDRSSETYHGLEMAMNESLLRDEAGVFPPRESDESHLLLAHRQLASDVAAEAVMSMPLRTPAGEAVGCVMLTGPETLLHGDRLPNFIRAAAPRLASALEVVARAESTRLGRAYRHTVTKLQTTRGKTWAIASLVVCAVLAMPVRYRVRCNCVTETSQRRFAVAPFDGQIEQGYVRPGDFVRKGDLLAKMDGQSIRWELAGVIAERGQASKKREMELASRNVPGSLLAQLEAERLEAREGLLNYRQSQIEIRSPIDGVVLSGSLERAEASAVALGDTVFEIGPLAEMRAELVIPAEEINQISEGASVRIWLDGLAGRSFTGVVERIRPRSELREARNVFVAEVMLPNENDLLRPGMKGTVRIDGERRSLAWNLFHKPAEYLAARFCWW